MVVQEDSSYTSDYLYPDKRSIANAIQIFFKDGTSTEKVVVEYPIGHKRRREEGTPLLYKKFADNMATKFSDKAVQELLELFKNQSTVENMAVNELMDRFSC